MISFIGLDNDTQYISGAGGGDQLFGGAGRDLLIGDSPADGFFVSTPKHRTAISMTMVTSTRSDIDILWRTFAMESTIPTTTIQKT